MRLMGGWWLGFRNRSDWSGDYLWCVGALVSFGIVWMIGTSIRMQMLCRIFLHLNMPNFGFFYAFFHRLIGLPLGFID